MANPEKFESDSNINGKLFSEELAEELINELYIGARNSFLKAAVLVGVEIKLTNKVQKIESIDYRELLFIYEIMSERYVLNFEGANGVKQLTIFWQEEQAEEWRSYWRKEIEDLLEDNYFNRTLLEYLTKSSEATDLSARKELVRLLETRYGIDRSDLATPKTEVLPDLESVNRLYGMNPFRVLSLFSNSESKAAHSSFQRLFNRAKVGQDVKLKGLFSLPATTCDARAIRSAFSELAILEDRLKSRLFWFTSESYSEEPADLEGLKRELGDLSIGQLDWDCEDSYFVAQNISILSHLESIYRDPGGFDKSIWLDALSRWGELLNNPEFWLHFHRLEVESGWQPQASKEDIIRLELSCWEDILSINAELAIKCWQSKEYAAVYNHLGIIKNAGLPWGSVKKAEEKIITFIENEVEELCDDFESRLEQNVEEYTETAELERVCTEFQQELQATLLPIALELNNMEFESYLAQHVRRKAAGATRALAVNLNNKLQDYIKAEELILLGHSLLEEEDPEYHSMEEDISIIAQNARSVKGGAGEDWPELSPPEETSDNSSEDSTITFHDEGELLKAAGEGKLDEVIAFLITIGADVNRTDEEGESALIAAACKGHAHVVQVLINAGAEVNAQSKSLYGPGFTALMWAAHEGYESVVEILLGAGAEQNLQTGHGFTALMWAGQEGYHKVACLLLEHGANVFLVNFDGETALTLAGKKGHDRIVELLRPMYDRSGRSRNEKGDTLLMHAAYNGLVNMVKELLDSGAEINCTNDDGKTALICASCKGHEGIVELLIARGANTGIKDRQGRNAYEWALYSGNSELARTIKKKSGFRGLFF